MLLRVLLLLVLVGLVFTWWTRHRRRGSPPPAPPGSPASPGTATGGEAMNRCPQCGVYTPSSQGWPGRGGTYCSAEHRAAHEGSTEP